jgi:hypothetical protein
MRVYVDGDLAMWLRKRYRFGKSSEVDRLLQSVASDDDGVYLALPNGDDSSRGDDLWFLAWLISDLRHCDPDFAFADAFRELAGRIEKRLTMSAIDRLAEIINPPSSDPVKLGETSRDRVRRLLQERGR